MRKIEQTDTLWFGKHKGKTVSECLQKDPTYLLWAHKKDILQLDDKCYAIAWEAHLDRCELSMSCQEMRV